ncbi:hypothetical protein GPS25_08500 [Campylobacter fetus]|jgi:hypothetical protein|uniref:Uncharacterized protein n=2 Tax=Campylobacter TaxID=194 RepID=A0A6F9JD48_CAMFE|nr:hypothetical protein [Campylobacter fetus]
MDAQNIKEIAEECGLTFSQRADNIRIATIFEDTKEPKFFFSAFIDDFKEQLKFYNIDLELSRCELDYQKKIMPQNVYDDKKIFLEKMQNFKNQVLNIDKNLSVADNSINDFMEDIEETKKLKANLAKHKAVIDKSEIHRTYSDESRVVATALAFFRDEKTEKTAADITLELNLLYPELFVPLSEQDVIHLKALSYISKAGADIINYDVAKTRYDIEKQLNKTLLHIGKEGADNINSDTNDEKTDNKTKTRRQ